jgi:hypothetical protein
MQLTTVHLRLLQDFIGLLSKPSPLSLGERPVVVKKLASLIHVDFIDTVRDLQTGRFEQAFQWGGESSMAVANEEHFRSVDPISPLLCGRRDPTLVEAIVDQKRFGKQHTSATFFHAIEPIGALTCICMTQAR